MVSPNDRIHSSLAPGRKSKEPMERKSAPTRSQQYPPRAASKKRIALLLLVFIALCPVAWWRVDPGDRLFMWSQARDLLSALEKVPVAKTQPPSDLPDIVILVPDTLRFDQMFAEDLSPKMPALAPYIQQGVVFENAYASSCWTVPTHASILTGLYPNIHKSDGENWLFGEKAPVLPELLRDRGYLTIGLSENPRLNRQFGFPRGFDLFDETYRRLFLDEFGTDAHAPETRIALTPYLIERLCRRLKSEDRPLFFFVNLMDVHWPYQPREPAYDPAKFDLPYSAAIEFQLHYAPVNWYLQKVPRRPKNLSILRYLYDLETHEVDEKLAAIIGSVQAHRNKKVVFFVVSDHGENFGEKGYLHHNFHLGQRLVRIPFFMIGTDLSSKVVREPVSVVDIMPTVAALTGFDPPEHEGRNLLEPLPADRPIFMSNAYPVVNLMFFKKEDWASPMLAPYLQAMSAVIQNGWKLVRPQNAPPELYHLTDDPAETKNKYGQGQAIEATLNENLDRYQARETNKYRATKPIEMDSMTIDSLRSLGYLN